jgi:antitoxin component YwqK of YwqJK toxin-antitoxin module
MQDIKPYNDKGQQHGLWERYHDNEQLWYKGEYINDLRHGPWIWYYENGKLRYKLTYIQGKLDGLVECYNQDGSIYKKEFYAR